MATYAITTKRRQGTVNVPKPLLERIEEAMENGWTSAFSCDEFVRHCVEDRLLEIESHALLKEAQSLHVETRPGGRSISSLGARQQSDLPPAASQ